MLARMKRLFSVFMAVSGSVVLAHTWFVHLTRHSVRSTELWLVTGAVPLTLLMILLDMARSGWRPDPPVANIHLGVFAVLLLALGAFFLADTTTWGPVGWLPIFATAYPLLLIRPRPSA